MRRLLALMAGLAVTGVLALDSAEAQEKKRIVVVTHGQAASGFWSVAKRGVDDAA